METNKIYQGDCLELMKQIEDKSVDMILCDLPYGVTACSWDVIIPLDKLWFEYKRIIKNKGIIILTATQPFASMLIMSNLEMFKYEWIWHKNTTSGFALAKKQPMRNHENILVFYRNQPTYNPIKELRDMSESSKKRMEYDFTSEKGINQINNGIKKFRFIPESKELCYPKTVQKINNITNNDNGRFHPTQKPVALFEYLIKTYTNEGDLVLDNCIGSGTTAVACVNTKRNFIGIELSEEYCKIANKRIEEVKQEAMQSEARHSSQA
jgi:site-specific DNA-methyltransferase (adenine-specific)